MKSQKGITLVSLIIYIIVMGIVLIVMSDMIANFYGNAERLNTDVEKILKFNKFNIYFLKEVKMYNNSVDTINSESNSQYILFTSGNSFLFDLNTIYYNNIEICDNVKNVNFECEKKSDENGNIKYGNIVEVTIEFEDFTKKIKYKLENIY